LIIELIILLPDLLKVKAEHADLQCCENLKQISEALERYRRHSLGGYPESLTDLVPRYVGKIPACKKSHTDVNKEI